MRSPAHATHQSMIRAATAPLAAAFLCFLCSCARGPSVVEIPDASIALGAETGLLDPGGGAVGSLDTSPSTAIADAGTIADAGGAADTTDGDGGRVSGETGAVPALNGCVPGLYRGTFEGRIGLYKLGLFDITGEIEIFAESDNAGEVLVASADSKLVGKDQDGNPIHADIEGAMNCRTLTLIGGALKNGVYVRKRLGQTVEFTGVVDGVYATKPVPSMTGTWQVAGGLETGSGTFHGELAQP